MSTILYWLGLFALIVTLICVASIPMMLWESRARKKKVEQLFAGREPLLYESYFEARGVPALIVSKLKTILEEELESDLSRLSADDDFTKNLSFFWGYDSMAHVEIVIRAEREFDIKITDAEAQNTHTVEDLVNLVWYKLRQRAA